MALSPLIAASAINGLKGSIGQQGSVSNGTNSAQSYQQSYSQTDAAAARAFSAEQAELAFKRQKQLMQMEQDYNSKEAQIARQWNEDMANSIYTRSVANMKEAGINPILAASMGLSGASVGSGATASVSGATAPMAQSFMDTSSASSGSSQSYGENHGSSWGTSESGIATGLGLLGQAISGAIEKIGSGKKIDIAINGLKDIFGSKDVDTGYSKAAEVVSDLTGAPKSKVKDIMMTKDSGKYKALTNAYQKREKLPWENGRMNEASWGYTK